MLDATFLRPIAHRGLHDAPRGIIENTAPAFVSAIAAGCGIECDLQPAADGEPMVFHDATLERLTLAAGPVAAHSAAELARLSYRCCSERMLRLDELLDLVAGRVPLLVEIKSDWGPLDAEFLGRIATAVRRYQGPLALMSFDPAAVVAMRSYVPGTPRGIVAGIYQGDGWWRGVLGDERRLALSHLLESRPAAPDFYAYHVGDLPTPVTRFVREVLRVPLLAWTVRSPPDWAGASRWADAAIFEGAAPEAARSMVAGR